jgi:hypothetical protein
MTNIAVTALLSCCCKKNEYLFIVCNFALLNRFKCTRHKYTEAPLFLLMYYCLQPASTSKKPYTISCVIIIGAKREIYRYITSIFNLHF